MKITDIVSAEMIPALTWLGKRDGLQYTTNEQSEIEFPLRSVSLSANELWLEASIRAILEDHNPDELIALNAVSKALAFGPKLFCPTADQCRAMQRVEPNLAFNDYKQPYPAVFLDLPAEYRNELECRLGTQLSRYVLVYHDEITHYIFVVQCVRPGDFSTLTLPSLPQFATIEEALVSNEAGLVYPQGLIHRVALNLCLLMAHFGVKEDGIANPGLAKKLKKASTHRRQSKAVSAQAQLAVLPTVIRFKQEITFDPMKMGDQQNSFGGTGSSKTPHWRKGHFKRQKIGRGWSETKVIFIPPALVNKHLFLGDVKDTKVVYRGKDSDA